MRSATVMFLNQPVTYYDYEIVEGLKGLLSRDKNNYWHKRVEEAAYFLHLNNTLSRAEENWMKAEGVVASQVERVLKEFVKIEMAHFQFKIEDTEDAQPQQQRDLENITALLEELSGYEIKKPVTATFIY